MKLKICGMRESVNVSKVIALKPDYMGFIFYPESSRFVGDLEYNIISLVKSQGIEPVAVFVNASMETMIQTCTWYGFTHVQLHGDETPQTCEVLRTKGLQVIKAFSVADSSDLKKTAVYENCCDYFLFDTKTALSGGSGRHFDWDLLKDYSGTKPFFLSGGIGVDDAEKVKAFYHPLLLGIDLNSRFETEPAVKEVGLLKCFINQLMEK